MDVKEAKEIIQFLAKGIDPVTGEMFPDNSPYNHPKVIRALFVAAENIHIQMFAPHKLMRACTRRSGGRQKAALLSFSLWQKEIEMDHDVGSTNKKESS